MTNDEIDDEIIQELEISAENLMEEEEAFAKTLLRGIEKMKSGGALTEEERKAIGDEIETFSTSDYWYKSKKRFSRLMEVLARLGYLDEYDPKAQYQRRPRTQVVDGRRWVIG